MRILTLTSLFPGSSQPRHGTFVRERVAAWRERHGGEVRVVAPVPFWPRILPSARWGHFARAPRRESFGGFEIEHPRYAMAPGIGVPLQGVLYEHGVRGAVRRLHREFRFQVLDAHYAYPDGFAAALLRQRLSVPSTLTVRGTDVNLLPQQRLVAPQVRFALRETDRVIAVAKALAELAVEAGADPSKVVVLRNGVDCARFRPLPRDQCRAALGIDRDRPAVATVGFLVPRKGHALLLRAFSLLERSNRPLLLIAGDGPEEAALRALANELELEPDVRFLGGVDHDRVAAVFSAADLSVLASEREGWPNVLLESLACGTPAVAAAVHGVPEIITSERLGLLVAERTPEAFAAALREALSRRFDRGAIRAHAETLDWSATADGMQREFEALAAR